MNDVLDTGRVPVEGYEVYHSQEFKDFCKRFGIPHGMRTRDICIVIPYEGTMSITHEYLATRSKEDDIPVPTFSIKSKH